MISFIPFFGYCFFVPSPLSPFILFWTLFLSLSPFILGIAILKISSSFLDLFLLLSFGSSFLSLIFFRLFGDLFLSLGVLYFGPFLDYIVFGERLSLFFFSLSLQKKKSFRDFLEDVCIFHFLLSFFSFCQTKEKLIFEKIVRTSFSLFSLSLFGGHSSLSVVPLFIPFVLGGIAVSFVWVIVFWFDFFFFLFSFSFLFLIFLLY